jgi:3-isopropylmalate/(R)-2-methylmalate dehydratase small subunit
MTETRNIRGKAAALRIDNLDTDQIMPKQFLRGIDKTGLDKGLLYDLRYDPAGQTRTDFVLNRPEHDGARILLGGSNFGCGSSREHAVWGLQQYGIQAVIAASFGEIFFSNAMNNRLLPVVLAPATVAMLMDASDRNPGRLLSIDLESMTVDSGDEVVPFSLSERHRRMFMEGLDLIGSSLLYQVEIDTFATAHWTRHPWLQDVALKTRERLGRT